jgi:hypothetical protein
MSDIKPWPMDIRVIEFTHALLALWCAKCLFYPPDNFQANPRSFYLLQTFSGREQFWGWLVGCAGILELIGIGLLFSFDGVAVLGWTLRVIGLSVTSMFFAMLGVSWTVGNWDNIAGPFILFSGIRGWQLLYLKIKRA